MMSSFHAWHAIMSFFVRLPSAGLGKLTFSNGIWPERNSATGGARALRSRGEFYSELSDAFMMIFDSKDPLGCWLSEQESDWISTEETRSSQRRSIRRLTIDFLRSFSGAALGLFLRSRMIPCSSSARTTLPVSSSSKRTMSPSGSLWFRKRSQIARARLVWGSRAETSFGTSKRSVAN